MLEILIKEWKEIKTIIDEKEKQLKDKRSEIMAIMEEMGLEKAEFATGKVSISKPKSFDEEACKKGSFEEYMQFIKVETIVQEVFNEADFGRTYPALLNKYMKPLTPRLTIK